MGCKMELLHKQSESLALQKLRDGTSSELRRYQAETEEAFNRGLCALRAQIEEEVRAKGLLGKEKGDLENQNLQLLSQINDLNGQVGHFWR